MEHREEKELRANARAKKLKGKQSFDMFDKPKGNKKYQIAELRLKEVGE